MTETKLKSKFPAPRPADAASCFDKDLSNEMTPADYFEPCFNFHSETDKRIDVKNFSKIKSDMKRLFSREKLGQMKFEPRQSKSKPLDKNDLMVLFESSLQGMALTQSAFDRQTEENIAFTLSSEGQGEEAGEVRESFQRMSESGTFEEEDLKQSFVSFLGTDKPDAADNPTLENLPHLIENVKFEKKLNFTKGTRTRDP